MKTPEELRAILDALPRPLYLAAVVQVFSDEADRSQVTLRRARPGESWYTATAIDEMRFLLDYMQEEERR